MSVAHTMPKDHIIARTINIVHSQKFDTYYECVMCGYEQEHDPGTEAVCPKCLCVHTIVKKKRFKTCVIQQWIEEEVKPSSQRGYHNKNTYKPVTA